jgi:hypothetical protein
MSVVEAPAAPLVATPEPCPPPPSEPSQVKVARQFGQGDRVQAPAVELLPDAVETLVGGRLVRFSLH